LSSSSNTVNNKFDVYSLFWYNGYTIEYAILKSSVFDITPSIPTETVHATAVFLKNNHSKKFNYGLSLCFRLLKSFATVLILKPSKITLWNSVRSFNVSLIYSTSNRWFLSSSKNSNFIINIS